MHVSIGGSRLVLLNGGHLIALMPRYRDVVCSIILPFLAGD